MLAETAAASFAHAQMLPTESIRLSRTASYRAALSKRNLQEYRLLGLRYGVVVV